jgi:TldD protein
MAATAVRSSTPANVGRRRHRFESYGLGVRTLIDGSWGFAATSTMTRAGAQSAAREAAIMSQAARVVKKRRVELAPVKPVTGTWMTPVQRDPLEVPIEEKIALLLAANEAALRSTASGS